MKRKPISAGELMAQLNADPDFVARREREEQARLERMAEYRRAQAPLLA